MRTKILIILIILIGLGIGGFFIYKNIFVSEEKLPEEKLEEGTQPILEIPESALKSKFGYCTHNVHNVEWQQLQEYRERYSCLNLSWERAHPGFANWQQIEPRKGEYHWERIDRYVRTTQERNIHILFTVKPFTDWDQETCNMHLEWQANDWGKDWGKFGKNKDFLVLAHRFGKPCDMEAYKEFLQRIVERYDGDGLDDISGLRYPVRYWEIGNEVDCGAFFQGSVEDYFEILKASYTTIKEADPNAKVLISALPSIGYGREQLPWWARPDFNPMKLFELGAADYFDIGNTHDVGADRHEIVREFLKKYGAGDKPIWMTEPAGITEYQERTETEEELALAYFQVFEEDSKYGTTMFFLGGCEDLDPALHTAISHINYIRDGGDSDSFYDVWCGNRIVQEGEECETMCPIYTYIDKCRVSAPKSVTDCDPIGGMAAECIDCACIYHKTVCGDNIPEGDEECETAWNCEFIRGMAPTCEGCKCVYHEGSYCGNDIPEEGEECERDFECDEPPEGFEVACEECKCVQYIESD